MSKLCQLVIAIAVSLALPSLSGCVMAPRVTQADLERNGTKVYAGQDPSRVVKASALALKTLGYQVVLEDVARGRVKTAPKVVQVVAVGTGTSIRTARAYENAIAWSLEVSGSGSSTTVKAVPRASTNGQPLDMSVVDASYMDQAFSTLWSEIESNLTLTPASSAPPKPASTPKATPNKKQPKTVHTAI